MKKNIFLALIIVASVISCSKSEFDNDFSNEVPVVFEFGGLTIDGETASTKIQDAVTGEIHTFTWEVGDQMTMILFNTPAGAGELSSENVMNFSSTNRFTAQTAGASTTFSGTLPKDKIDAKWNTEDNSNDRVPMWAIFPATDLTVEQTSSGKYYAITGPKIQSVQDGTGLKYCYFVAPKPTFNVDAFKTTSSPMPEFSLSNALVKFTMNTTKNVKKIVIYEGDSRSRLAGDAKYYTSSIGVQALLNKSTTLTIENGGLLPNEVYFACQYLHNGVAGGGTGTGSIKFTFTAEDNSTITKNLKITSQCSAMKISDLGTVTLDNWTPAE